MKEFGKALAVCIAVAIVLAAMANHEGGLHKPDPTPTCGVTK